MKDAIKKYKDFIVSWIKFIEEKIGRKAFIAISVGVVFLFVSLIMLSRPKNILQEYVQTEVPKLTIADATSIVESTLPTILNIYENPGEVFDVEEVMAEPNFDSIVDINDDSVIIDDYTEENIEKEKDRLSKIVEKYIINDYSVKIDDYFTGEGREEFENTTFNGKKYYEVIDEKTYFNTNIVSDENKFSKDSFTISNLVVVDGEITCKISFSRLLIDENDEVNYAVYTKELVLVKALNNWLVDSFNYSITK